QVVAKEGNYVTLRLRSTEMRMVRGECLATIGEVGNAEHELLTIGKAGKSRWLGRNPRVRGVAMNPVDHPLGGGDGKSSGGRPPTRGARSKARRRGIRRSIRRNSSCAAASAGRRRRNGTQRQEGPVCRRITDGEDPGPERAQREEGIQDLVTAQHDHA